MINKIIELIRLLDSEQRKKFLFVQLLAILTAGFELVTVASIGPFMLLVTEPNILNGDNLLAELFNISGLETKDDFVLLMGVVIISILVIGALTSSFTIWILSHFGQEIGVDIQNRLFHYYLTKNWLYHSRENSGNLIKQITAESNRVKTGIINPLMLLNAKIFSATFIIVGLTAYNPTIAIVLLAIFSVAYFVIYQLIKIRLSKLSKNVSISLTERFKEISEGLGGIRDVLFLGIQKRYIDRFEKSGSAFAKSQASIYALAQIPRYLMELVAFSCIIIFTLYSMRAYDGSLSTVVPILSVYALAGAKLLPALQQIYASFSMIQGNFSAFESIREDLQQSKNIDSKDNFNKECVNEAFSINKSISLQNIYFSYPGKPNTTLNDLTIDIPVNKTIGIIGSSGSGKSTIVDILLGLIEPDKGTIIIDEEFPVNNKNIHSMKKRIGFVPQFIFLSDASIKENIAFGESSEEIDEIKIDNALKLSNLKEFVSTLPEGFDTPVGQNGMQLSGGQRQRIGIARAIYRESEILIFDEATSSLDNITEAQVMRAIDNFSETKTIIIVAHRLTTVQKCDKLYLIDGGQVVDSGDYQHLLDNNKDFLEMATIKN